MISVFCIFKASDRPLLPNLLIHCLRHPLAPTFLHCVVFFWRVFSTVCIFWQLFSTVCIFWWDNADLLIFLRLRRPASPQPSSPGRRHQPLMEVSVWKCLIAVFWGYPRISLYSTVLYGFGVIPTPVLLWGSVHCCLSCSTLYCCLLPYSELQCLFSIVSSCILSYQLKWIPPNIGVSYLWFWASGYVLYKTCPAVECTQLFKPARGRVW